MYCGMRQRYEKAILRLAISILDNIFYDYGSRGIRPREPKNLASLLGEFTLHYSTLDYLGSACLAVADERRLAATLRRLHERNPTRIAELRAAIAEFAQEDLARHDTVLVDGWVLARAEAEALALIHTARRG